MRYTMFVLLAVCIVCIGGLWVYGHTKGKKWVGLKKEEVLPKTKNMELFCITPHGHTVYRYPDGQGQYVYVLLRHHDGYPMGITK